MTAIQNHTNIVEAIRHCERKAKAKDPSRPALIPGAAPRVTSNGRITVELPTVDGGAVRYTATQSAHGAMSRRRRIGGRPCSSVPRRPQRRLRPSLKTQPT